jgi:hypothetical protein
MKEKNRKLREGRMGGKRAGEDKKRKAKGMGERKRIMGEERKGGIRK